MNIYYLPSLLFFIFLSQFSNGQTYYSAGSGDWNKASTWANSENGPGGFGIPDPNAAVIIKSGHIVNLPANYTTGTMPEEIASHPAKGTEHFIHHGNVTINKGGTLQKTKGSAYVILTGETNVKGALVLNSRLYNLGDMTVFPKAKVTIEQELVLAGKSVTAIDIDFTAKTDIFFIGTHAALCGQGSILLESPEKVKIKEFDNASSTEQTCEGFLIDLNDTRGEFTVEFR